MATALLQVRIDEATKKRVDKKLKRMGMTASGAVNLLFHQIDIQDRIPFEIVGDKRESLKDSIENIEAGVGLSKKYKDTQELYKDLGI
ncbi:type II toxin-antitoxin system RelB/DinJ family antitoxin [Mitsuokella sp. WILCCON 0060]|uniref:type II toxin-antitoxin system RelB/DinJ family antitoxin n=1 Tax=unclassified Mitsuokella TaxID=2637239 RepID=UPI003EFE00CA